MRPENYGREPNQKPVRVTLLMTLGTAWAIALGASALSAPPAGGQNTNLNSVQDGPGDSDGGTTQNPNKKQEEDFDRLDGMGKSGKTAQVIEWEGNLEIHVYPPGSLAGLALKIDKSTGDKKVMVIGYRFRENPKTQLIRRAILGIPMSPGFKVFQDKTEGEFDKVIISNNGLGAPLVQYKLDPEPTQLYPEGHPALQDKSPSKEASSSAGSPQAGDSKRGPANHGSGSSGSQSDSPADSDGTIRPFGMQ